ncbi:uncharacterized protein LOC120842484 isoform X2 [Ixodes scapularis]|uniref:uncharacterized protein LOC120842484 isoform X2 n=1 Tax=Ixodes scapularis TaxID=6945 RepID=UPI001A9E4DB9|nr:uncharacterized protein LOC120842484 isoform X2 [Ixodes scapularis]
MNQAHRKNSGINPLTKRQRASSTSDSDDSLVSSSELQEARKMTKYWKARCKELREDNVFLQEQVRAQQALLGSKLFTMEEQQNQNKKAALNHGSPAEEADVVAEPRAAQGLKPRAEANPGLLVKTNMKKRSSVEASQGSQSSHSQAACTSASITAKQAGAASASRAASASCASTGAAHGGLAQAPQAVGPVAALTGSCPAEFTYMADGRFHLQKGIVLTSTQAKRVMAHTKPSLVVKETAQSIWTTPGLAVRSMSGQLPASKRASGELPKPALTPEKVNVVEATLHHWAGLKKVDVTAAVSNLGKILSEKIQDSIKSMRRKEAYQRI